MTQFICWVLFPLVLGLLSLGCGLLLERAANVRLADALLLPAGLAVIIVVGELTTKTVPRATTPVVIVVALVGFWLGKAWREPRRMLGWPLVAAVAVYFAYLAPVLLSGEPTFTGYVKLDDSATWMAMTDWVLAHGHDLSGLPPSTYEATLQFYLHGGEPVGALLPWGVGHQLVGQDLAWVFQPYLAYLGAMLALSAWAIVGPVVRSPRLRALVVFIAAQSALIYGYAMWGGVKEVAAGYLLALTPACAVAVFQGRVRPRSFLPLAAATGGMLSILAFGGAVWLALVLAVVGLAVLRLRARTSTRAQLATLVGLAVLLAVGLIRGAQSFLNSSGVLVSNELGNLLHPLNWRQLFGIWPASDFRLDPPDAFTLVHALIIAVVIGAAFGLVTAWRRRWWPPGLYLAASMVGVLLVSVKGSPWVQGKAFATASPALLLVGLAGAAAAASGDRMAKLPWEREPGSAGLVSGRRGVGAIAVVAIAFGVLWSNVLAYHHVTLAPYGQFAELERIGKLYAGQGPTLVNQYQVYATRHFLRNMDPESPSELRRRTIPLLNGQQVQKGGYADLDQLQLSQMLVFRTLVLPASPVASRPSSVYQLVFSGRWYQVWQRPPGLIPAVIGHIPLGSANDPTSVPVCRQVLGLARQAGPRGVLVAEARPSSAVMTVPSPLPTGITRTGFSTTTPGPYKVWLAGSFARRLITSVDGVRIGSIRGQINEAGGWTLLGTTSLGASSHGIALSYGDANLAPGSGGPGNGILTLPAGPLAVAPAAQYPPLTYVSPSAARSLCGTPWDWIEALPG